jgi:hypothetical protein
MDIKQLKKEISLTDKQIANFFNLNVSSYRNSTAKSRYEQALILFYNFINK